MINKELLNIMACPFCKNDLKLENNELHCTNPECLCRYLIEDDIPIMLIDQAKRPCPKCGSQRDWVEEKDLLVCPKCNTRLVYNR
ncbi:MAG: Trm112 family protein [Planctomycetota bacterium]